ncbi:phosphate/phosphite/phosphonate ABC transporter substrate-binding protein [Polynucleobacter yangtzensis]|jgi:phosphonate transport system substrate-binding protein|uniref:Phosphate ABC transporter substrate-binding protein n=1 Tax=Polynucleobacter yangtzensis TaxID=1743159 RepID=A0ABN6TRI8_9BURK|nr:phosphate/phosphite/phosphonate ABC transporter substrate-binding protein [Polynucleobacter yangtzensis]BDT79234.1 phosphate ABC transporter substrate-binding protein [Polynucleobacter yangtzensis]
MMIKKLITKKIVTYPHISSLVLSKIIFFILFISGSAHAACLGDQNSTKAFTVAVVPQLPRAATYAKWAPLLETIGRNTKQCFDLVIPETIPAFEKLLFKGVPDFAFVNPYHEVMAKKRKGYIPLVMDSRSKLTGILVVQVNSPIKSIQELNGKEIAFPAPNAFAASLLIRAELAKKGIYIKPKYLNTHASSYRAAAIGDVVASGGVNTTLQREELALRESLRVLYETSGYAPHPFVANPRVPINIRKSVADAFISLSGTESGDKLLEGIQMPIPIRSDYQRDYAPLESLNLEKFVVLDES